MHHCFSTSRSPVISVGTASHFHTRSNTPTDSDSGSFGTVGEYQQDVQCHHNNWNNMRAKDGFVTIGCRDCMARCRIATPITGGCPDFKRCGRCPLGASCPFLHIHRTKNTDLSPSPMVATTFDPVLHQAAVDVFRHRHGRPSKLLNEIGARRLQLLARGGSTPDSERVLSEVPAHTLVSSFSWSPYSVDVMVHSAATTAAPWQPHES